LGVLACSNKRGGGRSTKQPAQCLRPLIPGEKKGVFNVGTGRRTSSSAQRFARTDVGREGVKGFRFFENQQRTLPRRRRGEKILSGPKETDEKTRERSPPRAVTDREFKREKREKLSGPKSRETR